MRIVIPAIGSRGDVQPYINLSQGLQEAGHDVAIATNPTLCPLVDAHKIKSIPVGSSIDMSTIVEQIMKNSFNNLYLGAIRAMGMAAFLSEDAHADVLEACAGADLLIISDNVTGLAAAEKLKIPYISVTLHPMLVPSDPPTFLRRMQGIVEKLMILPVNRFRKRLKLPGVKSITDMQSRRLLLVPINNRVISPDRNWCQHVAQTNYWYARPIEDWSPPEDLVDFIHQGEKPLAVNLGVMSRSGKGIRESARIALEAIRRAGVRAIIQGWEKISAEITPTETLFYAGPLPHSWLFDHVSAVVHHGGFGTTAAVFRAGVPGIIIPHIMDQFYWGQQVARLGAGPKPILRTGLTAGKLHRAIQTVLHNTRMRENAAEIGKQIRSQPDGITQAVKIIEKSV